MEKFELLFDAKQYLRNNWEKGIACPCCNQLVKLWKKPLIGIAVADLLRLISLYRTEQDAIHISRFTDQRSNFYTLTYWGLIEKGDVRIDSKKRSSGYWKPTQKGILFATQQLTIPRIAMTYNNKLIKLAGENVGVIEALGKKFDYEELLNL